MKYLSVPIRKELANTFTPEGGAKVWSADQEPSAFRKYIFIRKGKEIHACPYRIMPAQISEDGFIRRIREVHVRP